MVQLWDVPASELLATGEPGLMPWVPLTRLDGPAPVILGECRRIIDEKAKPRERANLLAVKLFKDNVAVGLRAQSRVLLGALRLLLLAVVPI